MVYENDMQGLRFALEEEMNQDPQRSGGLCELARIGMMDSAYFEPLDDLLDRGAALVVIELDTDLDSRSEHIVGVRCHGRPLSALQLLHRSPLLSNQLSELQVAELYRVYMSQGSYTILTSTKVTFFYSVSYFVREPGQPTSPEMQKVKIRTGDVIELENGPTDFGRVSAVMVHERMVFLVVSWILPTRRVHPRLKLPEFKDAPLFSHPAFQPLTLVARPSLINRVHFAKLDGKVYLNTWVFNVV